MPLRLAPGPRAPRAPVAALGHAHRRQDLAELILVPRRRSRRRLLRVGRQLRVGARVFSCYLEGRLANVRPRPRPPGLRLRLAQHVPRHLGAVGRVVEPPARGLSLPLGFPATVAHHLPAPEVGCRPRHAVSLGYLRGGPAPGPATTRTFLSREIASLLGLGPRCLRRPGASSSTHSQSFSRLLG